MTLADIDVGLVMAFTGIALMINIWFGGAVRQFITTLRERAAADKVAKFTGRPQFTAADKKVEMDRWRQYTQAIKNEPIEGWHSEAGAPITLDDVIKGMNADNPSAVRCMEDIRRRGYVSRRMTLVGWLHSRLPPEPGNPNCPGNQDP